MSVSLGDYFLLQVQNSDDEFVAMAGLRTRVLALQARPLERLDFAVQGWRHLQAASGVHALNVAGNGLFTNQAADHLVRQLFMNGKHAMARIIVPEFGHFTGSFAVTELAYEGRNEEAVSWRVALQSAGEVAFAVA